MTCTCNENYLAIRSILTLPTQGKNNQQGNCSAPPWLSHSAVWEHQLPELPMLHKHCAPCIPWDWVSWTLAELMTVALWSWMARKLMPALFLQQDRAPKCTVHHWNPAARHWHWCRCPHQHPGAIRLSSWEKSKLFHLADRSSSFMNWVLTCSPSFVT